MVCDRHLLALPEPPLPDCYADLELSQDASSREIKLAYFRLAKQYHPDKKAPGKKEVDADQFRKDSARLESHPRCRITLKLTLSVESRSVKPTNYALTSQSAQLMMKVIRSLIYVPRGMGIDYGRRFCTRERKGSRSCSRRS